MSSALSPREKEIVMLICQEMSYKAIALHLGISKNTVRQHVAKARSKYNVCTNVGLALAFVTRYEHIADCEMGGKALS